MPLDPTASAALVKDLKKQLALVEADLRARSEQPDVEWAADLRAAYNSAFERGRTAQTWSAWRDDEVAQAAVAWVLATVFLRFCEDNDLLAGRWIAGPGGSLALAIDAEHAFYAADPTRDARAWLRDGFTALATTRPGAGILDHSHNPTWSTPLGVGTCKQLIAFWREQDGTGALLRDLSSATFDTRFLGDLYQDLSESAKKKYALLQTPVFVEQFILDRTLTPALAEFGLDGLRLIDPTCGSGHFLLGAFDRLLAEWRTAAPGLDDRELVQRALDHIHGVDLNPFAVAIARFRLAVAALHASGLRRLNDAPAFRYHLAVGDSLLAGMGHQGAFLDASGGLTDHHYPAEDVHEHPGILDPGRYQVVVGNPPYITVKDKALNEAYRKIYKTCHRQYALSVPFMELFFALAVRGAADAPAGFVGQITSNSFMKREFGTKLIETLLAGRDPGNPVDLLDVIDTSGAYIPGHGTPTVILVGRRQRPVAPTVRAVLGVRGEPGQPQDPAKGLVWTEIVDHIDDPGYDGAFVSVADLERDMLRTHPWSLSGGGAGAVKEAIDSAPTTLSAKVESIGFMAVTREDDAYLLGAPRLKQVGTNPTFARPLLGGTEVRDWTADRSNLALCTYTQEGEAEADEPALRTLWPLKQLLIRRRALSGTQLEQGLQWWEYSQLSKGRYLAKRVLAFAFVSTHNHFTLDSSGSLYIRSAPVIKLAAGASEDDHLALLGVLNSSAACFWLKQVSHDKGSQGVNEGFKSQDWERFYEFTGTKLQEFPLPAALPLAWGRRLDGLARELAQATPAAVCAAGAPDRAVLDAARADYDRIRAAMVAAQEELDWDVYRLYGLLDDDLTHHGDLPGGRLGERAFEIALARRVAAGEESTAWFERHGSAPITQIPARWPADYRATVQRRLDAIASNPAIRLLERPEFKRRWASQPWESMAKSALQAWLLDRLEDPALWSDQSGPRTASVNQLATALRADSGFRSVLGLWAGNADVDLAAGLAALLKDEAVPFLSALRYTPTGLVKRAEWEQVWALQRREDAGEKVSIPIPPKYTNKDFVRASYWQARGKLDVPKERFISYPGAQRSGDGSEVLGWAGWTHREQALALARLLMARREEDAWAADRLTPLLAGLAELEPWLHQWHADLDPAFGMSAAVAITGMIDNLCAELGLTRGDLADWRPSAPARGRRRGT